MISNAKRATTIVKMQTVMRPLSELAVGSLILSSRPDGSHYPNRLSRTDSEVVHTDSPSGHQT